ncbi:septum formation family protein [Nocardiopsis lambiniae]|uniref:Septum formation family protein n=1 Tax=Nocardiopsis lambiniae TaxID=3075539 RepID=A0ABU2MFL1_9ACTN|nr:septum formation family protein [Nocardiopsis sp. DSM 44743]MDT0331046.1 septum formation family protein [Nocardiopsis sp. DSM 44743]
MLSEKRRSPYGRLVIGPLVIGAALSLTACGPLELLPPALRTDAQPSPTPEEVDPVETETPYEEPVETETPAGPEDTDVFDIFLGDCLTEFGEGEISSVPRVDCAEPHLYEVYHVGDLSESGSYPGQDELGRMAFDFCVEPFETFTGEAHGSSSLDIEPLFPVENGWNEGDREVLCLIYDRDGDTVGSLGGTAL